MVIGGREWVGGGGGGGGWWLGGGGVGGGSTKGRLRKRGLRLKKCTVITTKI